MTTRRRLAAWMSAGLVAALFSAPAHTGTPAVLDPANILAARTAAQHEAIAKAYDEEAGTFERRAASHGILARDLSGVMKGSSSMSVHCKQIAQSLQSAAKSSRELAAEHRKMAQEAGG